MSRLNILRDRAAMLAKCRSFFAKRNILEVDTPILSPKASVDAHIDLITASCSRFLHSSPEYAMKRLLSDGIGDIYQLSHVFRDGERGSKHNPEFMMAEWYRVGFSYEMMIDETCCFIRLFLGDLPQEKLTYRQAMIDHANIDPFQISENDLQKLIPGHSGVQNKDDLLGIILAMKVEPRLGADKLTVITDYPPSQAALAKIAGNTAKRFEVYYQGVELANGYDELADPEKQEQRFIEANNLRQKMGKESLPVDKKFLESLKKLPSCCGVAVGFDRLMMLRHKKTDIADVLPFSWTGI